VWDFLRLKVKSPGENTPQAYLIQQLTLVWLGFERQLRSVPIVRKLHQGQFTLEDYKALLRSLLSHQNHCQSCSRVDYDSEAAFALSV